MVALLKYKIFIIAILLLIYNTSNAQNVGLDNIALQDIKRVQSLLDSNINYKSFAIRNNTFFQNFESINWKKLELTNFSFEYLHQNNSKQPYGYNDGALGTSVGTQLYINPQLNLQWGRITLQLSPEKVFAENSSIDGLSNDFEGYQNGDAFWKRYYEISENIIENPSRAYKRYSENLYPGQSNLLYNSKTVSYGISTENLWWGPGINHSLVLTNNAPGFPHVTINTHKPIKTNIGNIEFQVIGGSLTNLDAPPTNNDNPYAAQYSIKKPNLDRYITGMIFTINPEWTKNLTIGIANMAYMYKKNMNGLEDATPLTNFTKFTKLKQRPALGSVFIRYAFPKDHAEFYLEYGRNDRGATPINIFYDSIPTGYVGGIRKLYPLGLNANNGAITLNIEIVHMEMQNPNQIWTSNLLAKKTSWYTNDQVPQGYTNFGQIIGSAVGPGSNGQNLNIAWVKGVKKIGIGIERLVHNKDFYYYNYFNGLAYPGPNFKYWADLTYDLNFRWNIGNLIFSADYKLSDYYNYMWTKTGTGGLYGPSDTDKKNIQIVLAAKYIISKKQK